VNVQAGMLQPRISRGLRGTVHCRTYVYHSWHLNITETNLYHRIPYVCSRVKPAFMLSVWIMSPTRNEVFDPKWDREKAVFYASDI